MAEIHFVPQVAPTDFERLYRLQGDPFFTTLADYEAWHRGMSLLRIFWASGGERLRLVGVKEGGRLVAAARLLRVPFYERKAWGSKEEARGEIQDLALLRPDQRVLALMMRGAEEAFQEFGLAAFGVSAWNPKHWPVLEEIGLKPYKRSIVLGWEVARRLPKEGNPAVVVRTASRDQRALLRRIQQSSWGFFIPPDFDHHKVLVAWLDDEPVGSAYLNRNTGNLDFGVHVVRERWRQRIGTAILEAARQWCLSWGMPRMTVVRVWRALTRINPHDRQAWCFYRACGGHLLREVRGFRRKMRPRAVVVPDLPDCRGLGS